MWRRWEWRALIFILTSSSSEDFLIFLIICTPEKHKNSTSLGCWIFDSKFYLCTISHRKNNFYEINAFRIKIINFLIDFIFYFYFDDSPAQTCSVHLLSGQLLVNISYFQLLLLACVRLRPAHANNSSCQWQSQREI